MTRHRNRVAATIRSILGSLALLAVAWPCGHAGGSAVAAELVDRNPFDPHRQPWKAPPPSTPALPALTPQDLQIEGIFSFGSTRGILAQLDGKLRGTLPGNAAGKVRISVGQSFGAGYVLDSVAANQVVVVGGNARYTIPIVRKLNRGPAPMPATLAPEQRPAPPLATPAASPPAGAASGVAAGPASVPAQTTAAPIAPGPQAAPPPATPTQASSQPVPAAAQQTSPPQPMSLLEAIQAAQAAARNQQNPPPPAVNPFALPRK
ncbi:MAG: hypothetical protein WCV99_01225 [Sterolibacterium sp.]